jgi:hypothetical protein
VYAWAFKARFPRQASGWRGSRLTIARYCARNPVALERLTYVADERHVTDRSDKAAHRWAALLRQIFAFITARAVIDRILTHFHTRRRSPHNAVADSAGRDWNPEAAPGSSHWIQEREKSAAA